MGRRSAITTVFGMLLVVSLDARAQPASTAGEALFSLVNRAVLPDHGRTVQPHYVRNGDVPCQRVSKWLGVAFDPSVGVLVRRTESFGPMFAQRPLTIGSRKLNLGLSFQRTSFNSVDGLPLDDIRAKRYLASTTVACCRCRWTSIKSSRVPPTGSLIASK